MISKAMAIAFWTLSALLTGIILCSLTGCGGAATTYDHGIPNLHQVSPGIWRSGQPTTKEQWQYLYSLGIRTSLKLNDVRESDDSLASQAGPDTITIAYQPLEPRGDRDIISDITGTFVHPAEKDIQTIISVLRAGGVVPGGVLVHCTHGQDRTGLVVGLYRVSVEGWAPEVAYNEMLAMGFHSELHGLQGYWETFALEHE
jgi:protein tyrosine/serine phosphatase